MVSEPKGSCNTTIHDSTIIQESNLRFLKRNHGCYLKKKEDVELKEKSDHHRHLSRRRKPPDETKKIRTPRGEELTESPHKERKADEKRTIRVTTIERETFREDHNIGGSRQRFEMPFKVTGLSNHGQSLGSEISANSQMRAKRKPAHNCSVFENLSFSSFGNAVVVYDVDDAFLYLPLPYEHQLHRQCLIIPRGHYPSLIATPPFISGSCNVLKSPIYSKAVVKATDSDLAAASSEVRLVRARKKAIYNSLTPSNSWTAPKSKSESRDFEEKQLEIQSKEIHWGEGKTSAIRCNDIP
ncbi:hypothetical protein Tco_0420767 [Tanacetum coccineum]